MDAGRGRWLLIALEGLLIAGAVLLGWLFDQPPLARCHWSLAGFAWGVVGTVPMLAGLAVCLIWPDGPWRSLTRLVDEMLVPLFQGWRWYELTLVAVLAGLGEEMLFRGVIQEVIQRLAGQGPLAAIIAIGAGGVLFGLAHSVSLAYAVFAGLIGIYLGALFVLVGDLTAPIVAHAAYDFVALVYLSRIRPRRLTVGNDCPVR